VKDTATFEISTKPLPDMQESAVYFKALRKPFRLHFQQVPSIAGLHFLAGSNCVRVEIGASDIEDISELRGITNLRELVIGQTPFTVRKELKIDAVASLSHLDTLVLNMSRVTTLEPVRHLKQLVTLNIGGSLVNDLSPISGLRSLKSVDVRDSRVVDLSPLHGASRLEEMNIDAKQAPSLDRVPQIKTLMIIAQVSVDLTKVAALSSLTSLSIWGPPVIDLSPLRKLSMLKTLNVSGIGFTSGLSQVIDVDAIGELTHLESLSLGELQITSLRFLAGRNNLVELNLGRIPVTSAPELGTLVSLRKLSLAQVPIVDISPLLSLPNLATLSLSGTPARADVISQLEKQGVKVTIN
jgi:internalin A